MGEHHKALVWGAKRRRRRRQRPGGAAPNHGCYYGPPPTGPPQPPAPPPPPPPPAPDTNGQVGDGANDDGGRSRERARVKEAYEVKLCPFPHGAAWRAWRANTIHAIISAAGRQDDLAQEWILKVEPHDSGQLEEPGEGWISLDRKLAAALTNIAHGEIGRQHHAGNDDCIKQQYRRTRKGPSCISCP